MSVIDHAFQERTQKAATQRLPPAEAFAAILVAAVAVGEELRAGGSARLDGVLIKNRG